MEGKQFLYFLLDAEGRSYYVENGLVSVSSIPMPLNYTPDGWQEVAIFFERNKKYFAIDRSYSIPLKFVEDGATIIKHLYYNYGIEAAATLAIAEQTVEFDGTEYGYKYEHLYKGELDFATFNHSGVKVTVNIMEGDLVKYLKANENTVYEIPLPTENILKMDGLELAGSVKWAFGGGNFSIFDAQAMASINRYDWPLLQLEPSEGAVLDIAPSSVENANGYADFASDWENHDNGYHFLTANKNITFKLEIDIKGTFHGDGTSVIFIYKNEAPPPYSSSVFTVSRHNPSDPPQIDVHYSKQFTLNAGDKLYFMHLIFSHVGDVSVDYEASELKASFTNRYHATEINFIKPLDLLQALVDKAVGKLPAEPRKYTVESTLLTDNSDLVVTSGDGVRSLKDAVVKTSIKSFFSAYNMMLNAGMSTVKRKLLFESKSYWYSETNIVDLGEVSNLSVTPATDYLFNAIKIGYPNQNYDQALGDINGRYEFNVTQNYTAPVTRSMTVLDLTTSYRADMYGIEFTRINLDGKLTTDSSSDNDVFIIKTKKNADSDGKYSLWRGSGGNNNGVNAKFDVATAFNVDISPRQCLLKHGNYLRGCLHRLETKSLTFETADKSDEDLYINGIKERSNVSISSLDAPLFSYNTLKFTTQIPISLQAILNANPLQAFSFTYYGIPFKGINIRIGMQPSSEKAQEWTLLSAPENDLTKLIDVYE